MLYLYRKTIKEPFNIHHFPNQEIYVDTDCLQKLKRDDVVRLGLRYENSDDLMALMLVKGQLDDLGFKDIRLTIPYFPYSTMDHSDGTRPLSLKYVARFINSLNFSSVTVCEPHSIVLEAMIDRLTVMWTTEQLLEHAIAGEHALMANGGEKLHPILCFPDAGAAKRYKSIEATMPTLTFDKIRDFETGRIKGMRCLDALPQFADNDVCFIVDDLCRKGRTFTSCADVLKEAGAKRVVLVVTHIEQVAFDGVLLPESSVDCVYALNTCLPYNFVKPNPKLHILYLNFSS